MSKKSYKRLQNRLYREIKRRMILEHSLKKPPKFHVEERKFDALRIRHIIPNSAFRAGCEEEVIQIMTKELIKKLCDGQYITFLTKKKDGLDFLQEYTEVEAVLEVVRPRTNENAEEAEDGQG